MSSLDRRQGRPGDGADGQRRGLRLLVDAPVLETPSGVERARRLGVGDAVLRGEPRGEGRRRPQPRAAVAQVVRVGPPQRSPREAVRVRTFERYGPSGFYSTRLLQK